MIPTSSSACKHRYLAKTRARRNELVVEIQGESVAVQSKWFESFPLKSVAEAGAGGWELEKKPSLFLVPWLEEE